MSNMYRKPVKSSNILSIGYDDDELILEIEFKNNAVYHYYDVPYNVYNNLMNASSHGKYLISNIQDNYKYKRI